MQRTQCELAVLAPGGEKSTSGDEAVGLKVEGTVGGGWLERCKVGLLDLKAADKEHLVLDAGGLEKVAELEVVDVDTGGDDVWVGGIDVLHSTGHLSLRAEFRESRREEREERVRAGLEAQEWLARMAKAMVGG